MRFYDLQSALSSAAIETPARCSRPVAAADRLKSGYVESGRSACPAPSQRTCGTRRLTRLAREVAEVLAQTRLDDLVSGAEGRQETLIGTGACCCPARCVQRLAIAARCSAGPRPAGVDERPRSVERPQ
jgi:hypothetical protein